MSLPGTLKEPDRIYVEFLRTKLVEPIRNGTNFKSTLSFARRHTRIVETLSGDGSKTEFVLSNTKLLNIISVSISGTAKVKYQEYNIDFNENAIIFVTAPASGTNNITVIYEYSSTGSSWIFQDKPRLDLSPAQYPRIGTQMITESGEPVGLFDDHAWNTITMQIDVLTYKDLIIKAGRGSTTHQI